MTDIQSLLDLPYETLALLASGYLAYRLAYVGKDAAHSSVDVVFLTVVFAFVAKQTTVSVDLLMWSTHQTPGGIFASLAGMVSALISAAVWRRSLQEFVYAALRKVKVSDHDGQPNVWRSMMARTLQPPARLVVVLKNGSSLMCNQLAMFKDAPMGPCLFGQDGSVAMYVTDIRRPADQDWTEVEALDPNRPDWGYEMSFIPADEIARIDVTRPA